MRKFSAIELAVLVLGIFFFLAGVVNVIHPREHFLFDASKDFSISAGYSSKEKVRTYGLLSAVLGAGMVGMVVFRRRK